MLCLLWRVVRDDGMIKFVVAAFLLIVSFEASAAVRYMVAGMTCSDVQASLQRDGVAVLYRQGDAGIKLYDRFVAGPSFCGTGDMIAMERVAVADTDDCRVAKCVELRRFGK